MTRGPGKEHKLTGHHQPEEFGKGQKETPLVLPTSQNPHRRTPSWLSNVWATRKDPESEWLARDNLEANPITIKPKTGSHVAEQPSWIPLPSCSLMGTLPNKVCSFVSMCVSSDNSFLSISPEPTLRSWKLPTTTFLQHSQEERSGIGKQRRGQGQQRVRHCANHHHGATLQDPLFPPGNWGSKNLREFADSHPTD